MTLLLFGFLLPARGQDLTINPKFPADTCASLGATVSIRVYAYASSTNYPITFQWQREGTNLPAATNVTLVLTNITVAHAGGYMAWITNAIGNFTNTRTAILTVDTTFTQITAGPLVKDTVGGWNASWVDYDGDGKLDVSLAPSGNILEPTRIYHNEGGGTFRRVMTNAIAQTAVQSWAHVWADYDNDGKVDLFVPNINGLNDMLFHNDGNGSFTRITKGHPVMNPTTSNVGVWADYDRDGCLDLFVTDDCPSLYRGNGDGTFRKMTLAEAGSISSCLLSDYAVWADVDNDGWPELYRNAVQNVSISNWSMTNHVYHLDSQGKFYLMDIGEMKKGREGYTGIIWVDYDNDGLQDAVVGAERGRLGLYRNLGEQGFTNVAASAFPSPLTNSLAWQTVDYDNDGWQDLVVYPWVTSPAALYRNNGDGTFTRVNIGGPTSTPESLCWGDYDNDGFQDILALHGPGARNSLYRHNGNSNHWLKVKLDGRASNRSGIGAKVRVHATIGGRTFWQMREISGQGFGVDNGLLAHFGLGDATVVDLIRVEWPLGNVQEVAGVIPDRMLTLTEPIRINPVRPTASLGASVTLTSAGTGIAYQWLHNGTNLVGRTSRALTLSNLVAADAGRYSVVVTPSNGSTETNYTYLHVDTQFTKVTEGPVVADRLDTGGGSWVDIDQDGYIDLVVWNGGFTGSVQTNRVFRNNQAGGFERLTAAEAGDIVRVSGRWWAGVWGDLDRDGDVDCVALREPPPMNCFLNDGSGIFTDWKSSDPLVSDKGGGLAALADYDNDGWLDVSVISAWGSVHTNRLYHGIGGGRFESVTTGPMVTDRFVGTEAQAWGDYDGDGDLDLIVTDPHAWWQNPNAFPVSLYRNDGAGQFSRIANGVIHEAKGAFLVPAWADYDNDGKIDLFLSNYEGPSRLFHNKGNGEFTSQTIQTGPASGYPAWGDFDNDGDLDLVLATGQANDQTNLFFLNEGGQLTRTSMGSLTSELGKTGPILWGDYDNDGFLDLFVGRTYNQIASLFHNNGNSNHWLMVNLKGTTSNPSAIGAKVRVQAGIWGRWVVQLREISGGNRYQGDPRAHFGLGNATNAVTVRIEWPSGTLQVLQNVAADQILQVIEPRRPVLAVEFTPTQVTGTLTGDTNQVYELQVSNGLDAGWTALTNVNTDASGKGNWTDAGVAPQGGRFYKAVKTP